MSTPPSTTSPDPRGGYKPKKPAVKTNRVVVTRAIWYVLGVVTAILAVRIALLMLSANPETPFVEFVYGISWYFIVPFWGIFDEPDYTRFYIDTSSLVAIVVYWLLALGLAKLVNLTR